MKAIAIAYQVAGEAIWERYKQALNKNETELAIELKNIALSMAKTADEHCGQGVNIPARKPIKPSLAEKIKDIAKKSLCES